MSRAEIKIGPVAGSHFRGPADLVVAKHVTVGGRKGYFVTRKWLADRKAFEYDPRLGWAYDRWFEWGNE